MKLPFYFWFELMSFLVAALCYIKTKGSLVGKFVPYLFFIVVFEYGSWYNWFMINGSNLWSINIEIIIEFLFYSLFFYKAAADRRLKLFVIWGFGICVVIIAINLLFLQGIWKLNSYSYLITSVFFLINIYYLIRELLQKGVEVSDLLTRNPYFWIAIGLFFFHIIGFVFYAFFEYMAYSKDYTYYYTFKGISTASIIILYTCLTIGFLCYRFTRK